jgi:predicted transcriptional regulator
MEEPDARSRLVRDVMGDSFPVVEASAPLRELAEQLQGRCTAVLVRQPDGELSILTRTDLIRALGGS